MQRKDGDWGIDEIPSSVLPTLQIVGKPVMISHKEGEVGSVGVISDCWFDKYNGCHVKMVVDNPFLESFIARNNTENTDTMRGLSISHVKQPTPEGDKYEITEVSICNNPARYGCVINNRMTPDEYKEYTTSQAYSSSASVPDPVNRKHLANSLIASVQTMEPQGPSGTPHIVTDPGSASVATSASGAAASAGNTTNMTTTHGSAPANGTSQQQQQQQQQQSSSTSAPPASQQGGAAPPSQDDLLKAIMALPAESALKVNIMKAMQAQEDGIVAREKEIVALRGQVAEAAQAVTTVQASRDSFAKRIVDSVQDTLDAYLGEVDDSYVSPSEQKMAKDDLRILMRDYPHFGPSLRVLAHASRHPKRKQVNDEDLMAEAVKFSKREFAFSRPEQQVVGGFEEMRMPGAIQVNASRAGVSNAGYSSSMAAQAGPAAGAARAPGAFAGDPDKFQRYLRAAGLQS